MGKDSLSWVTGLPVEHEPISTAGKTVPPITGAQTELRPGVEFDRPTVDKEHPAVKRCRCSIFDLTTEAREGAGQLGGSGRR